MLAQLFERSMGLGPEWEVSDVWFEERDGAPDELHVRVAHVRGRAVECPECGRRCGTYDTLCLVKPDFRLGGGTGNLCLITSELRI